MSHSEAHTVDVALARQPQLTIVHKERWLEVIDHDAICHRVEELFQETKGKQIYENHKHQFNKVENQDVLHSIVSGPYRRVVFISSQV